MSAAPLALRGAPGSPYTRKMLALLRYRRIPYRLLVSQRAVSAMPQPKVALLPTFYFPNQDGGLDAVVDSTPIIRRLEREHTARAVTPPDPVLNFIDELLEDYGDEWLTKAMFHYRWVYPPDIELASDIIPRWRDVSGAEELMRQHKAMFAQRQIGRLGVVGSNAVTGPVIEASYRRFLGLMDAHLQTQPFLMGQRPGASDFAVYGQLTQLTHFDPTPTALAQRVAPRVFAWVDVMEDLSGQEPGDNDWTPGDDIPISLRALLTEVGRVYVPFLLANARAVSAGAAQVQAVIDGAPWVQEPFRYQALCLRWLRESHARLADGPRARVDRLLAECGCAELVHAKL